MTIYCDIDGTLTDSPHKSGGKLRADVAQKLKSLTSLGHDVILWSHRGSDYVAEFAREHAIDAVACLKKPDLLIDDKSAIARPITAEEFLKVRLHKSYRRRKHES